MNNNSNNLMNNSINNNNINKNNINIISPSIDNIEEEKSN